MDLIYQISLALIMIVIGLIAFEDYRQSDSKTKNSDMRFLGIGVVSFLAGIVYLIGILI